MYNLSIILIQIIFFIGRFLNSKINAGYLGRKNWRDRLSDFKQKNSGQLFWIHCASLGEFEMARPLIDEVRKNNLAVKILITFFSPSGYELRKNYKDVDGVFYLPFDSVANARDFVSITKPTVAVFVKYEFWFNYLNALKNSKSKIILINGLFRAKQPFFKWWGGEFREALKHFDHIFLQNKLSKKLLETIYINKTSVTGDLRYDRVVANSKVIKQYDVLNTFLQDSFIIIGGSTWPEEENILAYCIEHAQSEIKLIIAPHDVSEKHLKQIEQRLGRFDVKRFSILKESDNPQVVLVDSIGHLASLYQYAKVALVGGGFTGALHNIIEPAVFGIPIYFGYKHDKFPEAEYFIQNKIGVQIHNGFNFTEHIKELITKPNLLEIIKKRTPSVFKAHLGGTEQVYYKMKGYLSYKS